MENHYKNYKNLIAKRAWVWHLRTGQDFEELFAKGNLVYCLCLKDYDPEKSKFSTYLYDRLQHCYRNILKKSQPFYSDINVENISLTKDSLNKLCNKDIFNKIYDYLGNGRKANIFKLYFSTHLTMEDVAFVFDISKTRVHQIINYELKPKIKKRFQTVV